MDNRINQYDIWDDEEESLEEYYKTRQQTKKEHDSLETRSNKYTYNWERVAEDFTEEIHIDGKLKGPIHYEIQYNIQRQLLAEIKINLNEEDKNLTSKRAKSLECKNKNFYSNNNYLFCLENPNIKLEKTRMIHTKTKQNNYEFKFLFSTSPLALENIIFNTSLINHLYNEIVTIV